MRNVTQTLIKVNLVSLQKDIEDEDTLFSFSFDAINQKYLLKDKVCIRYANSGQKMLKRNSSCS